jgi:hypothetical protein
LCKLPRHGVFSATRSNEQDVHAPKSKPVGRVPQSVFSTRDAHFPR